MSVIRSNVIQNTSIREAYIRGVKLLKREFLGPTTSDFGISGATTPLSTYDLFVVWHHFALFTFTPIGQLDRTVGQRGPAFLPWHRFMLMLFEQQLQRVLDDGNFGLPYWNITADGALPPSQQQNAPLWQGNTFGGTGNPITSGPFSFDPNDPNSWQIKLEPTLMGQIRQVNRGLRRSLGIHTRNLPTQLQLSQAIALRSYDTPPWNSTSNGFRNRLEGWRPLSVFPGLHNRVHLWVGGDMLLSTSPNDPVFYLHQCNTDRAWETWMQQNGRVYLPVQSESSLLLGHRIDDAMMSLLSDPMTPRQVLNLTHLYTYDKLVI